ncbi:MAG: hypothetical protein QOF96_986 [Actinomycetota bacterium]|jgi:hypothetical protein|nr:hypothetical protein [Actinomycetota bacterium]MDQ1566106.1 hypothetical protein [Actinomycetota bacterium]
MGTTYANVTVVGADHDAVVAALGPGPALVTDTVDGLTVVFAATDEEAARFGEGLTAATLSGTCGGLALEVSVFDDDILQYRLYRDGTEIDVGVVATQVAVELAELAGGALPVPDAARLVERLGRGDAALAGRALSSDEPIGSASDRHAWLVEALDLPRCAPGWGYRYLTSFPDGFDGGPLTEVGDAGPQEAS